MNAGVIIVTYNRKELLKECLDCVMNQTLPFSCVCIVDNHSIDGTEEYLKQFRDAFPRTTDGQTGATGSERTPDSPIFKIFRLSSNRGGAGGFSYGLKKMAESSCDWLLLIDDDAMLRPDYLEKLAKALEMSGSSEKRGKLSSSPTQKQYLACSGSVMTGEGLDLLHRRRITSSCLMTSAPVPAAEYEKETFEYDIGTFCGLMLQTRLVRQIGFPKSEYFIWFDDTEYCLRFRGQSPILNVNQAVLDHKTQTGPETPPISWKNFYGFRNAIDIGRTYSSHPAVFMTYIWMNHLAHIAIDTAGILLGSHRDARRYRRQIYIDVLRGRRRPPRGKDPRYLPGSGPKLTD